MPPKKEEPKAEKPVLGRFRNNLKMGIVGLPNVGKSTLFNVLTKLSVPAENFPFCTIDPNAARVNVPDERFDWLCKHYKPKSEVAAFLEIVDIAGLVRGASQGEGLGNAFLSHIRGVDGVYHVLRAFDDAEVTHVDESIDPVRDLDTITKELIAKDLETVKATHENLERVVARGIDKTKKAELEVVTRVLQCLQDGKCVKDIEWKASDYEAINSLTCLTAKPVIYLVNLSEQDFIRKKNKWLAKIKEWVDAHGGGNIIPFSGALESKLNDMGSDEERKRYEEEIKCASAIPKIVKTGYTGLHLLHFFTAGTDEVKCWTVRKGTKMPQAAGTIHSDMEKGFICAEVMKFDEYKELGSESAVKAAGKYRQQGKNDLVCDGDIVYFKFN
mmetsp:Transcript_21228/g.36463  ORF Transcript_21228/g.36463 Transcript_21228/m.36463 type:complete len:386 (-) Transcript_21228:351-1508(-)|eukprot:CAMPEP_0196662952 /NCGR_PEP_ID=MMETSP1086-20130531/50986_1 /TAXON_ID=77921 /ORGANISM="Cyanoptyche  gloeocystis , Strain SAG4.97" /LENGTH=385 /DNA_ID=CAMNT_0041998589 /DNA_START=109 /DNA_END=1266 /DNA_ORIENTATION=+